MAENTPTLAERVQALPQELFETIREDVFTCLVGVRRVEIDPYDRYTYTQSYEDFIKPMVTHYPTIENAHSLIRVSKATHAKFLQSYYSSVFVVDCLLVSRWLRGLGTKYKTQIEEVRVMGGEVWPDMFGETSLLRIETARGYLEESETAAMRAKIKFVKQDEVTEIRDPTWDW